MNNDQQKFDELFTHIAGQAGGLQPLFDAFFGFLNRKTDFYVQFDQDTQEKQYSMGFPKGQAQKLLLNAFKKYPFKDVAPKPSETTQQSTIAAASSSSLSPNKHNTIAAVPTAAPCSIPVPAPVPAPALVASTAAQQKEELIVKEVAMPILVNGKQVPIGNGGVGIGYYWTQSLNDLTVFIDTSTGTKSKDIVCDIKARRLLLKIRGSVIIEGDLEEAVKVDESMWTISIASSSTQVVITLDKCVKTWWKHVIIGHPEIDTTKVDSSQNIGEYDESTQAAIRKIMHEQQIKALADREAAPVGGKPGSLSFATAAAVTGDELDMASIREGILNGTIMPPLPEGFGRS